MRIRSAFRVWLPMALAATLTLGVAYVVAQQVYRTSANYPRQWMAEDLLARLASGEDHVVFAARSLVEPERRIDALGRGVMAGWAITILATLGAAVLASPRRGTVSA